MLEDPALEDIEDLLPRGSWKDVTPSAGTAAALKILDTDRPAVKVSVRHAVVTPRPDSLLWESSDWDLTNCPCSLLSLHPCDQSLRQSAAGPGPRFTRSRPLGGDVPGTQTVFLKTQGCSHNVSDGEYMAGMLASYGYTITDQWTDDADIFLFNSCTVKGPSQDSFLNMVSKARTTGKPVVVAGCVPQGQPDRDDLAGVSIVGVQQIHRVVEIVEEAVKGNVVRLLGQRQRPSLDLPKIRRNALVEIVPISTGCLNHCTYCKTKHARGDLGSYESAAIVRRVCTAVQEGVREVWMTSEDTGAYGKDIGTNLPTLLNSVLDALPEGVMLRLGMTNPPHILEHVEAVAEVLNNKKCFKFLHIPVQCGSDKVLADMKREYTVKDFEKLADYLIEHVPGITIATDIICGFPTEDEEDFKGSLALLEKYKFPIINIAQFYPRPGTPAAKMKRVPTGIVKDRSRAVTSYFESYKVWDSMVGTTQQVWIVEYGKDPNYVAGHARNYAQVLLPRDERIMGRSVMARIDTAEKWCVKGTVLEILAENIILPQVSTSRTNVLPTRQHLESAERSTPNRRTRVSSSKSREMDSRLGAVEEHHARDVPAVSLTPADLVIAGVMFIVLFFVSMLAPIEAFLGLGAFVADKIAEKHARRIAALSQGLKVVEPRRKAVWADLKGDSEWVKHEDGGNVGERMHSALPSGRKVEIGFEFFEVSPSAPVSLPLKDDDFEGENCKSAIEPGEGTAKCDENVCCGGNGQGSCCGNGEGGGCD